MEKKPYALCCEDNGKMIALWQGLKVTELNVGEVYDMHLDYGWVKVTLGRDEDGKFFWVTPDQEKFYQPVAPVGIR